MDLYSLEFFVEKVDIPLDKINKSNLNIKVSCTDLIDIIIKYYIKNSAYNVIEGTGCGKAVVFSTTIDKILSDICTEIRVVITPVDEFEVIGNADITWNDNFSEQVRNFGKGVGYVEHKAKYKLMNNETTRGTIQITMCLVYHGENIEIPITYLGSQINIPLTFRRKTYIKHTTETVASEAWNPLYYEHKKAAKSIIDPGMEMYAHFAGVPVKPPMTTLLTPEYINKNLCGHKTCPGAQKFKEFGLGPLCPPGSGLGTVTSLKDVKPLGLYGMSQAYGTLDAYGAYGMFVKKPNKPKTCCGSPDCPYTIFYGKPDPKSSVDDLDERPKKCQCKNCSKSSGSTRSSKQSSKASTCGSPKCPKNAPPPDDIICPFLKPPIPPSPCCIKPKTKPKEVACPFQPNKQPRQSAGADRYNSDCPDTSCPYSSGQQRKQSNGNRGQSPNGRNGTGCGGKVCPLESNSDDLNELVSMDYSSPPPRERSVNYNGKNGNNGKNGTGTCCGKVCPLESSNAPAKSKRASVSLSEEEDFLKCLGRDTCPNYAQERNQMSNGNKRKSQSQDPVTYMGNETQDECPDTCLYYPKKKKNCKDKDCPYYKPENCKDLNCHIYAEEEEVVEEEGSCGGRICPLDRDRQRNGNGKDPAEIFSEFRDTIRRASKDPEFNQKRLSLLVNEEGKKLLISGGNGDSKAVRKELLASMSLGDNSDIYALISRLVADRQQTTSLNNYFAPDGMPSSPDMNDLYEQRDKKKRKGPCSKDSCRAIKYKTCSECGGVSKSGATCDNTDVSFSTISYDSYATTGGQEMTPKTDESKTAPASSLKKKVDPTPTKDKVAVKIVRPHKQRTRFVYNEGENYPGIRLGHKKCSTATKNVPAHMGWLWNIKGDWERKRRKNYRPGKVSKTVEERIVQNRRSKGIPDPPELTMLVKKKKFKYNAEESESDDEEIVPKPTLTIEKKEGNYLITMNPLKDPKTLADNENPYMRCKPMQFLILKAKKEPPPEAPPVSRYVEYDGEDGEGDYQPFYDTCLCDEDKNSASSSSSDSELNIEFTTPAGLITPERMKKMINVVMVSNQFKEADFHCPDCPTIVPTIYKKDRRKKKK